MVDVLAVSPHLDDAALSCGATLAQWAAEGREVLVYSAFAGLPKAPFPAAARPFHDMWDLHDDPVGARRAEDLAGMRALGATGAHGPFLDAIYREGVDEPALAGRLERAVTRLIEAHRPGLVVSCSALGDHEDHLLARDAVIRAVAGSGTDLLLWEDLPYAIWTREPPPLPVGLRWRTAATSECRADAWRAKAEAVACYASQHTMLSNGGAPIMEQLERHATTLGGGSGRGELMWAVEGRPA